VDTSTIREIHNKKEPWGPRDKSDLKKAGELREGGTTGSPLTGEGERKKKIDTPFQAVLRKEVCNKKGKGREDKRLGNVSSRGRKTNGSDKGMSDRAHIV